MNIHEIQSEIIRLKKEKDICILAHSYQAEEILEVADFTGDSYKLSVDASKVPNSTIIMSGVRFMAETCKILSPEKRVFLPNPDAGCAMADQMDKELISVVKEQYPDYTVVAYINTTADLKTICDVCVTSSSAVEICRKIENDKILFIPDCNLGAYVAAQIPEKTFKLLSGGCPIHACVSTDDVKTAKRLHPDALLLVHPECRPDVCAMADYIGSTSGIMNFAIKSDCKEFIIGTEISIQEHLQYCCPDKNFYYLTKKLICPNMKSTTLVDLYNCVAGKSGEEIILPPDTISQARKCIDEMIRLGNA
ncbi:MAG: quinolinate synthase NadA [Clostridia bacterium]|nr:quinolinate synthase NadA [Clostridia bacterium]